MQHSHVEPDAFPGVGSAPQARETMLYTSFRGYPSSSKGRRIP
jgi:hypothetical protein